jgi:hypothetical protein
MKGVAAAISSFQSKKSLVNPFLSSYLTSFKCFFVVIGKYWAGVVELVDTPDLGSGGASRGGSSPSARTTRFAKN